MDQKLEQEQKNTQREIKTGLEKIVTRILKDFGKDQRVDPQVVSKLTNFTQNYIYYMLSECNQIAEFMNYQNIDGEQVDIVISTLNQKVKVIKRSQAQKIADKVGNDKNHNLNPDESMLKSFNKSKDPRKHIT